MAEVITQEELVLHFKNNQSAMASWATVDRNTFKNQLKRGVVVVDGILYKKVTEVGELPEYTGGDFISATLYKDLVLSVYTQTGSVGKTASLVMDGTPKTNRKEYNYWVNHLTKWIKEDPSIKVDTNQT